MCWVLSQMYLTRLFVSDDGFIALALNELKKLNCGDCQSNCRLGTLLCFEALLCHLSREMWLDGAGARSLLDAFRLRHSLCYHRAIIPRRLCTVSNAETSIDCSNWQLYEFLYTRLLQEHRYAVSMATMARCIAAAAAMAAPMQHQRKQLALPTLTCSSS